MLVGAIVAGLGWLVTLVLAPETKGMLLTESSAVPQSTNVIAEKPNSVAGGGRAQAAL